jgi:hypothetical protein
VKSPIRLSQLQNGVPDALGRALAPSAVEPSELELQQWASQLGSALGVALTPPVAAVSGAVMAAKAKATATVTASATAAAASAAKTLPAWKLGAWVLGGVVLGAGLSGAVRAGFSASDNSAPAVVGIPSAAVEAAPSAFAAPNLPVVPQPPLPQASAIAAPPVGRPTHSAPSSSSVEVPSEPPLPSVDELSVLHQAQAALRRNPAEALALSARHAREFPGGALAQEREVIAIDALLRLGRRDEATSRAQRFAARYPGSAHAQRVAQLLKNAEMR